MSLGRYLRKDWKDGREGATWTAEEKRSRRDAPGVSLEREEDVVTAEQPRGRAAGEVSQDLEPALRPF